MSLTGLNCNKHWTRREQGFNLRNVISLIFSLHIRRDYLWCTSRLFVYSWPQTVNFVQILQKGAFRNFRPESPPTPHFGKLQIWDDQSLLRNTPPPPPPQARNPRDHMWRLICIPRGYHSVKRWFARVERTQNTPNRATYLTCIRLM